MWPCESSSRVGRFFPMISGVIVREASAWIKTQNHHLNFVPLLLEYQNVKIMFGPQCLSHGTRWTLHSLLSLMCVIRNPYHANFHERIMFKMADRDFIGTISDDEEVAVASESSESDEEVRLYESNWKFHRLLPLMIFVATTTAMIIRICLYSHGHNSPLSPR